MIISSEDGPCTYLQNVQIITFIMSPPLYRECKYMVYVLLCTQQEFLAEAVGRSVTWVYCRSVRLGLARNIFDL